MKLEDPAGTLGKKWSSASLRHYENRSVIFFYRLRYWVRIWRAFSWHAFDSVVKVLYEKKEENNWKRRTGCVAITIIDEGCFLLANHNTSPYPFFQQREREMYIHVDTNWINTIHMYTKSHTFIQINIRKHTKINIYEDLFHCVLCQCKLVVSLKVLNIYSSPYSWHHRRQNRQNCIHLTHGQVNR